MRDRETERGTETQKQRDKETKSREVKRKRNTERQGDKEADTHT